MLIRTHVVAGNYGEAIRQYELYRRLLPESLGLTPSTHIRDLMAPLPSG